LIVEYSANRAKKDAFNKEHALKKLEYQILHNIKNFGTLKGHSIYPKQIYKLDRFITESETE